MEKDYEPTRERVKEVFGEVLLHYRRQIGISQDELALQCGLDRTYISLLERGKRMPTIHTIFLIAPYLQIQSDAFLKEIEQRLPLDTDD